MPTYFVNVCETLAEMPVTIIVLTMALWALQQNSGAKARAGAVAIGCVFGTDTSPVSTHLKIQI